MALLEKHLYVKKSTIPNAGKGLFTKVFIPKGTRIIEYKGRRSKWKDVKDDDGKNAYIFYVNRNNAIDAFPTLQHKARYANDAKGLTRVKGLRNNCDYVTEGVRAFIESHRDIPARSEIFVDYGPDYWKTIRENIRIDKDDSKKKKTSKKSKSKSKSKKTKTAKNVKHKTAKRVDTHLRH